MDCWEPSLDHTPYPTASSSSVLTLVSFRCIQTFAQGPTLGPARGQR